MRTLETLLLATAASAFLALPACSQSTAPEPTAQQNGALKKAKQVQSQAQSSQCCLNGACFQCNSKAALDKCLGFDVTACMNNCDPQDWHCFVDCANEVSNATHDPSACTGGAGGGSSSSSSSGGWPGGGSSSGGWPGDDGDDGWPGGGSWPSGGGNGCGISIQCNNGSCQCGDTGQACSGTSGTPNSCDVVCRRCN